MYVLNELNSSSAKLRNRDGLGGSVNVRRDQRDEQDRWRALVDEHSPACAVLIVLCLAIIRHTRLLSFTATSAYSRHHHDRKKSI